MVETIYHRNNSLKPVGGHGNPDYDDFMWIVEPNQDGSLYVLTPGPDVQIHKLGLTVKELAEELSPYASEDSPFVYTAEKKNTLITLNATNGAALRYFSAGGSGIMDSRSCRRVTGLEIDEDDECEPTPTINLGRSEYTIGIQDRDTGENICTIKYFEWTPNNRDRDLQAQYLATMDSKYIYTRFDGGVLAFNHNKEDKSDPEQRFLYRRKFTHSPVVRVFDVARPQGADARDIPLVILPQPVAPAMTADPSQTVFINCTDTGSWYALSEANYPSVTDGAAEAKCYQRASWTNDRSLWNEQKEFNPKELVGVHSLADFSGGPHDVPTISGPDSILPRMPEVPFGLMNDSVEDPSLEIPASKFSVLSRAKVPAWLLGLIVLLFALGYQRGIKFGATASQSTRLEEPVTLPAVSPEPAPALVPELEPVEPVDGVVVEVKQPQSQGERKVHFAAQGEVEEQNPTTDAAEESVPLERSLTGESDSLGTEPTEGTEPDGQTPKKKKTHRGKQVIFSPAVGMSHTFKGQRGGAKRNKNKKKQENDETTDEATRIIEGVVKHEAGMRPDEQHTVIEGNVQDVSGDVRLNNLIVRSDRILGYGSGGTVVYEGSFEGRDVAVKRMLLQYFDLASQEVALLQQSDDDPNVIRYFCHQKDRDFLYIALERCRSSLYDLYKEGQSQDGLTDDQVKIITDVNSNVPDALFQLAKGLNHLHGLRIIHRDIKPQNILIAHPKKNQKAGPRLVISDFGLCRTLPDNVSTLVGTIGNAGTTGWKAPELIGQPRDADGKQSSTGNGTNTNNDNSSSSQEGSSNSSGVKRAVDIFSLGCVFFYVLTNGAHPFDQADGEVWHLERELNIKRDNSNLQPLRDLGADASEPLHLVEWMLAPRPELRPTAAQVLAHPFFWRPDKRLSFLCDVSDHFEREPREPLSYELQRLESLVDHTVHAGDFLRRLDRRFVDSLGKQRKYSPDRALDLLRALRNKKNHYADLPEDVQARVGELPEGYLKYWTVRFPNLLMTCWEVVRDLGLEDSPRFRGYMREGE